MSSINMYNLAKIRIHKDASKNIPATGQRRDMLFKALRKIQVSPELKGDTQWGNDQTQVTVIVGYAISWTYTEGIISVLDIRGQ